MFRKLLRYLVILAFLWLFLWLAVIGIKHGLRDTAEARIIEMAMEDFSSPSFVSERFGDDIKFSDHLIVQNLGYLFPYRASAEEKFKIVLETQKFPLSDEVSLLARGNKRGWTYSRYTTGNCVDGTCPFEGWRVEQVYESIYDSSRPTDYRYTEVAVSWLWYKYDIIYWIRYNSRDEAVKYGVSLLDWPLSFIDVAIRQLENRNPPYRKGPLLYARYFAFSAPNFEREN